MYRQILKRHGNYILRTRKIEDVLVTYTWEYSREMSNLIKKYGVIEDWHINNLHKRTNKCNYSFYLVHIAVKSRISFREMLKHTQEKHINVLIQYSNKVGKYA